MGTPADSPPGGWGYAKKRPAPIVSPIPDGVWEQPPLVLEIKTELNTSTARIQYGDQVIFYGQHTLEVSQLRETVKYYKESRDRWKHVAMILGYSGKPDMKLTRKQKRAAKKWRKKYGL